jgi:DNA-directed RNA polymerase subunit M/transcription elongation factor TFIIS
MASAPDIRTMRESVELLRVKNNEFLSSKFIELLFSINVNGEGIVKDNRQSKSDVLELIGLVRIVGEESVMELIKTYKNLTLQEIIRKSNTFMKARKQNFLATTVELKEKKKIASIVKCPKCRSNEVETKTVQIRAGDEASTDKNICRKCNYKFSIN